MELEVRVGVDFGKLQNEMPKIIDKFLVDSLADASIKESKDNIRKGGIRPALKKSTKDIRKRKGIVGTKPLFATGNLVNSLQKTKDGIKMAGYGKLHHEGYVTDADSMIPGKTVPARPFLVVPRLKSFVNDFMKQVKKAMVRKPPLVLKSE